MASIDASYQDSAQKIVAERHLGNRIPGFTTNLSW
jgi:hypothetical protein